MQRIRRISLLAIVIFLGACEGNFIPKPKGYNRIDLPEHEYQLSPDSLPYQFEFSKSAVLEPHRSSFGKNSWVDIKYFGLGGEIQVTYLPIKNGEKDLIGMINDAFKLTSKHQVKATGIERVEMNIDSLSSATIFRLEGEVPSQYQFFATDSTKNFLRGALYFTTSTKNDSLKPVIEFIAVDIMHMIETLDWQE